MTPDAPRTDQLRTQIDFLTEPDRPKIVCLCGSTRFAEEMNFEAEQETLMGNIVVRPEVVAYHAGDDPQFNFPEVKADLDRLHLRKIDLADEVIVVMVDGYIGESTRNEIAYAEKVGKTIKYIAWDEWERRTTVEQAAALYDAGLRAQPDAGVRKPDGWHTYHICNGLLRELVWSGPDVLCAHCGDWFHAEVKHKAASRDAGPEGTA